MTRSRRRSALGFFLFFALFWTAIVGVFDCFVGFNMYRQSRAESYPVAAGTVTRSEVTSSRDSDGDVSYRPEISFTYEVDGRPYTTDGYRYGTWGSSNRGDAAAVVDRYPVGAAVEVHYNPDDPTDAVLQVGVGSMDMFLMLFLTPFNLVMLWLWAFIAGAVRRKISSPPAGGVPIVQRGMMTHVRLPRYSPLTAAGGTALIISFLSIFIIAFSTGMDPPMWAIQTVWACVLGLALLVYFQRTWLVGSGAKDLVIDDETKTLSLPQTFGRKTDVIMAYGAVSKLDVQTIAHRGSKGATSYTYAPRLVWSDESGATHEEKLAEWHDAQRAEAFIAWLTEMVDQREAMSDER